MRRALLPAMISAALALYAHDSQAQNDRFAYAITDVTKEGAGWSALRKLDLQTGQYSEVILNGMDLNTKVYDALTRKELSLRPDPKFGSLLQTPFSNGVAAAAYDKKNNRIYFTPMFVDQLRYLDLKTNKVYYVTDQAFTGLGNMHNDEGKIITRMVIAPDGYGYAISNDGNTFIRFTTGRKLKIENLGALVDDPANTSGVSIHNRCTSFGGDMISDDRGNLYILSARNQVFRINTETKVVSHLGSIQGLPAHFTTNGAAVDADGNLLLSSAVDASSYYTLNPKNWTAAPYSLPSIFRSSDLANSNYLQTASRGKEPVSLIPSNIQKDVKAFQVSVYPNPVRNNRITIQFNKLPAGNYVLELRDVLGRSVQQQRIVVSTETQVETFNIQDADAKGVYMISVADAARQTVFTQKIVIQ